VGEAFVEGMQLRQRGQLEAATEALERAVQEDPELSLAWFWLGATKDNRGLESEAIPAYEQALALGLGHPENAKAWTWLASSYSKTGRYREALRSIARAEDLGGYEPTAEFERIAQDVRRRLNQTANRREAR